jgi:hypothetical protein
MPLRVPVEFPAAVLRRGRVLLSLFPESSEASVDGLHCGLEVFLMLLKLFLKLVPVLVIELVELNVS